MPVEGKGLRLKIFVLTLSLYNIGFDMCYKGKRQIDFPSLLNSVSFFLILFKAPGVRTVVEFHKANKRITATNSTIKRCVSLFYFPEGKSLFLSIVCLSLSQPKMLLWFKCVFVEVILINHLGKN